MLHPTIIIECKTKKYRNNIYHLNGPSFISHGIDFLFFENETSQMILYFSKMNPQLSLSISGHLDVLY